MRTRTRTLRQDKVILSWRTTVSGEFQKNGSNVIVFGTALLILLLLDVKLLFAPVHIVLIDLLLLLGVETLFLFPKRYIITKRGILVHGLFRSWEHFANYRKVRRLNVIQLRRKRFGALSPVIIAVNIGEIDKVAEVIAEYVK
jgi:hypothetical protein